jgi:perosamine synthetase
MIPQYEPIFDIDDLNTKFSSYFQSGGWMTEYKKTEDFENRIKEFLNVKHCLMVNNGTISLSLALMTCGIGKDDEVLIPDITMVATANAVKFIGAVPVFVDVEEHNLCMNLEDAWLKSTSRTKAMIYVTLNGRSTNHNEIHDFCSQYHLAYISDDAQSLGSAYSDATLIGSSGDIASFSFSMPKIITTGQGGCLVTNNDDLALKIKRLKDFGRDTGGLDYHPYFGINSKFTDLQAVVGLSQFKTLDWRIKRKKEIYQLYYDTLKDIDQIQFLPTILLWETPWFIDIYVQNRKELISYLNENEIGSRPIYPALDSQPIYKDSDASCPIASKMSSLGLWLPSSLTLTDNDILFVCDKIRQFYNK